MNEKIIPYIDFYHINGRVLYRTNGGMYTLSLIDRFLLLIGIYSGWDLIKKYDR